MVGWENPRILILGAGFALLSLVATLAIVGVIVVRLPADHFVRKSPRPLPGHPTWVRWLATIARNLGGVTLVLAGLLMSVPGVPGQGLLTMLLGVMLIDLPGVRRAERWLLRHEFVRTPIERLRQRCGRPPLVIPPADSV
jgi:hypothetical protein